MAFEWDQAEIVELRLTILDLTGPSEFLSKFLRHIELRNAKNEKGHSEDDKKQI